MIPLLRTLAGRLPGVTFPALPLPFHAWDAANHLPAGHLLLPADWAWRLTSTTLLPTHHRLVLYWFDSETVCNDTITRFPVLHITHADNSTPRLRAPPRGFVLRTYDLVHHTRCLFSLHTRMPRVAGQADKKDEERKKVRACIAIAHRHRIPSYFPASPLYRVPNKRLSERATAAAATMRLRCRAYSRAYGTNVTMTRERAYIRVAKPQRNNELAIT